MGELRASNMRVAFRTDASLEIGTGHVMRCLTLASMLRSRGAECIFLSRAHEGHLLEQIERQGFTAFVLDEHPSSSLQKGVTADGQPPHAAWLGTSWENDAGDSQSALSTFSSMGPVDWLVVDHYGLDIQWERAMRESCIKLLVIDDLADRAHDCDLLLDQNLGRDAADYASRASRNTHLLMGPEYALLRPEFSEARDASLRRRSSPTLQQILVTMGGVDKGNFTRQVLMALNDCPLPEDVHVVAVMGPHAPWLDDIRELTNGMRVATSVKVGVTNMAELMSVSDVAIGAGGSTTWERCSVGLPAVLASIAANQEHITQAIVQSGAALECDMDSMHSTFMDLFASRDLPSRLAAMSRAAAAVTDGEGAQRVSGEMMC